MFQRARSRPSLRREERLVFVVGSPRSGTTFLGNSLGAQPGLVDLGEVKPLKSAIPELTRLPEAAAAARLRRVLEVVRTLGLASHLRGVEQTPETSFLVGAVLRAYPAARAVHMVRDGRDVVCSLLERGWLGAEREGADDAGLAYGAHARFWVETDRTEEFRSASEAKRAAWAWRRYVTAARAVPERTLELRYEELVTSPRKVAGQLATFLELAAEPLTNSLSSAFDRSVGRWQRDLTPEQLSDVEEEAGALLQDLGYL
ncbi:MAG: sulfotransferase family protein [Gaiellaceae bacterium]